MKKHTILYSCWLVLLASISLSGCKKSHPIELYSFAKNESIITLKSVSPSKAIFRVSHSGSKEIHWNLNLNDSNGGTGWGGEQLYTLDDGSLVYCGIAFDPEILRACWTIRGSVATRLKSPILEEKPTLQDWSGRSLGFGSDGSWWLWRDDELTFSKSHNEPALPLTLPFSPPYRRVAYTAATNRFALVHGEGPQSQLEVVGADMKSIDAHKLSSSYVSPVWTQDGTTLGFVENHELWLWKPGSKAVKLTERTKGPDGRDEEIHMVGFSPDGTQALVRSSRFQPMDHNPMAGVYNPVFESFAIDVSSRTWKRLPQTGEVALWLKN